MVERMRAEARLLFVFAGPASDAFFAVPTFVAAATVAARHGFGPVTWLHHPRLTPFTDVLRVGLWPMRDRLDFRATEECPKMRPAGLPQGQEPPEKPGCADWGLWTSEQWLHQHPLHAACVNASPRGLPPNGMHVVEHIYRGVRLPGGPPRVSLDRQAIGNLVPSAPEGAVVFHPCSTSPEKTPGDLPYCRLPEGTVVVRGPQDVGLPEAVVERFGYREERERPAMYLASLVAKARLVVGVSSAWTTLAALCGVPVVVVHEVTTIEQRGVTPFGGIDLVGMKHPQVLEHLVSRLLAGEAK